MVSSFMDALQRDERVQEERGDGMSIIIKGMEMPKSCQDCQFLCWSGGYVCPASRMDMGLTLYVKSRHKNCPLIELPPHGRLIDADAIQDYNVETFGQRLLIIDTAPTVIEAEGSET